MNLIIAGGGTGGHLFPGIAVYEKLKNMDSDIKVYFIGTERGIENKIKDGYGFELLTIDVKGFSGKSVMKKLNSIKSMFKAAKTVGSIYERVKPDYVLGLGGYISLIPLIVAKLKKIECGIMEQNAVPGLSNKILAFLGVTVFASFEDTKKHLRFAQIITTGNPVREKIFKLSLAESGKKKEFADKKNLSIFIFGGSQGASSVNEAVLKMFSELSDEISKNITVYHQTGERDLEKVKNFYEKSKIGEYEFFSFTDNIERYYSESDIVICRAGAGTLSELVLLRKPAILIPYRHAAKNHQDKNASLFSDKKCFIKIKDGRELSKELLQTIYKIFYNRDLLKYMRENLKKFEIKDSALEIANIILKLNKTNIDNNLNN
jgi:UDP-N-acetylglucosamine--N-acetylmuramyl-(pentapeptide) pyrophosphoryl-undecaprenol N-acetylglucosamine transferase